MEWTNRTGRVALAGLALVAVACARDRVVPAETPRVERATARQERDPRAFPAMEVAGQIRKASLAPDVFLPGHDTESYDHVEGNVFLESIRSPLSTFSIDVDTASYANVRRFLSEGRLPPAGAVRIEEMINYFPYDYASPTGNDAPFEVDIEVSPAPWNPAHDLARIGIRGVEIPDSQRPPANLVFLLDVSGSMRPANKLPLLRSAMKLLTDALRGRDRVGIVVYAGAAGLVLPPTSADDGETIRSALDRLEAGGSTAGGAGIALAYRTARENFIPGGINRVILATDGDFNVGVTDESELVRMIRREAASGVFLTVLGFGMGNYKDSMLEKLADRGNGNYAYIDTLHEARKVLVEQVGSTLLTIAKDVKLQVEFNPARVRAYRLIGYENRLLHDRDFNDDTKDAGEIGSGHTVTALYELVPPGAALDGPGIDPLKYQAPPSPSEEAETDELFTLKIRYKQPNGSRSRLLEFPAGAGRMRTGSGSDDLRFAAAVAWFGMKLRASEFVEGTTWDEVAGLARSGIGSDAAGYRTAFLDLVERARSLEESTASITD